MTPETALKHATTVYKKLEEQSMPAELAGEGEPGEKLYRGSLSRVIFEQCRLPNSYYTPVMRMLRTLGCIVTLEKGTNRSPSLVKLVKPPPDELPANHPARQKAEILHSEGLTGADQGDKLRPLLREALEGYKDFQEWRDSQMGVNVPEALRNAEARLRALEEAIQVLQQIQGEK